MGRILFVFIFSALFLPSAKMERPGKIIAAEIIAAIIKRRRNEKQKIILAATKNKPPLINGQIFLPIIFISAFVFIFQRFFFDGKNISRPQRSGGSDHPAKENRRILLAGFSLFIF